MREAEQLVAYKNKADQRAAIERRRAANTERAFEYMLDECWICNENDRDCLDFHHITPKMGGKSIKGAGMTYSWERQKIELDKCALLCANCHRKVHARMSNKAKSL